MIKIQYLHNNIFPSKHDTKINYDIFSNTIVDKYHTVVLINKNNILIKYTEVCYAKLNVRFKMLKNIK